MTTTAWLRLKKGDVPGGLPPDAESNPPPMVEKLAEDVLINADSIWCSIQDGEPFCNMIVSAKRGDKEDVEGVWFMLDTHNFHFVAYGETIEVVELEDEPRESERKFIRKTHEYLAETGRAAKEHTREKPSNPWDVTAPPLEVVPAILVADSGELAGKCCQCESVRNPDGSAVMWRCQKCERHVCRGCTLTIPYSHPEEYYEATLCSPECWILAGRPEE